ncbi:MAG: response regulator [Lacipirellulaceae bacterium]
MAGTPYFVQECPTCGRNLQVRVSYLGKNVACRHCGVKFEARDPDSSEPLPAESGIALLARADELLLQASSMQGKLDASSRC